MSPRKKVFGVGWAKTGTTTLGECMKILGYDHVSQRMDLVPDLGEGNLARILETAASKESFDDWPWIILYRELDNAFPGSKFILTVRDPESWIQSYRGQLARSHIAEAEANRSEEMLKNRRILYGLPFPDVSDEDLIARYNRHNHEVKEHFSNRPDNLLTVDWASGDGWVQLCTFLGVDVPGIPFPHANVRPAEPSTAVHTHTGATIWMQRIRSLFKGKLS